MADTSCLNREDLYSGKLTTARKSSRLRERKESDRILEKDYESNWESRKKEDKERVTLKCQTKNQVRLEATVKSRWEN